MSKVMTVLCELPASESPWIAAAYGDLIILCNVEHEPLYFQDGKLVTLDTARTEPGEAGFIEDEIHYISKE
jgi:hypothetical protein